MKFAAAVQSIGSLGHGLVPSVSLVKRVARHVKGDKESCEQCRVRKSIIGGARQPDRSALFISQ